MQNRRYTQPVRTRLFQRLWGEESMGRMGVGRCLLP